MEARSRDPVAYFERTASAYDELARGRREFTERVAVFSRMAGRSPHPGSRALDLGCGSGRLCRELSNTGFAVTGVDGSETMVALSRVAVPSGRFLVHKFPLSSAALNELRGAFDLVTASSVIEYVEDDETFMCQVYECLKPGGVALVSFPNGQSVYRKFEWLALRLGLAPPTSYLRVQRHQYHERDARLLAQRAGFRDGSGEYLTLPLQRLLPRTRARPAWVAPLFVLELWRPSDQVGARRESPDTSGMSAHRLDRNANT